MPAFTLNHPPVTTPQQLPELLRPTIERHRDDADELGALPEPLLDELRAAGAFRLYTPRELGGFEAAPGVVLDVLERLARLDGPTAWTVSNLNMGFLAGQLEDDSVARIWRDADPLIANSDSPGALTPADGGFRLNGRWKILSGAARADWFVLAGMTPAATAHTSAGWGAGLFLCAVPRADVRVPETWRIAGPQQAEANTVVAENVFVPTGMAADLFTPNRVDARPIYRHCSVAFVYPGYAAVLIGMAQAAVDELAALPRAGAAGERVRAAVERATTEVAAARGLLLETAHDLDRAVAAGRRTTHFQRAALRGAICHVTDTSRTVLTSLHELGSSSHRLDRLFRDGMAAAQAAHAATIQYALAGRIVHGNPA